MLHKFKDRAIELSKNYQTAHPFPHVVIDNFLPSTILDLAEKEVKNHSDWYHDSTEYVEKHQVRKFYTPSPIDTFEDSMINLRKSCPFTIHILEYLYSPDILKFLEDLTGIQNLKGDPTWLGGGLHKILSGGKLGIHADFNIHWKLNLHRRINLLLYLNKDWKPEYGGDLELWEKDLSRCAAKIQPIFNRAVIFNITDDAYHGHPEPLSTPENVARYSMALYYYTEDRPEHEKAPGHPVLWKSPG